MRNPHIVIISILIIAGLVYAAFATDLVYPKKVDDFATCIAAGNPVMESLPRQCRDAKTGTLYVEEIERPVTNEMIRVNVPDPNESISAPFVSSGEARGNWFFEASFPIEVRGNDGTILGTGHGEAKGEWMTTDFVPWTASLTFDPKGRTEGVVRYMKDNPSGLPENDAHIDVPVKFKSSPATTTAACRPTGCSGQICSDEDVVSTCEFRSEYMCYKTAECKRQSNGRCGWTQTAALASCLANPPALQ
jgi:hypothetical protein